MGFIGDLFSGSKGAGFQGQYASGMQNMDWTGFIPQQQGVINQNAGQAGNALSQQQAFVNALQSQGRMGMGSQGQLTQQLQQQAQGKGPNPAQSMLNQATGRNIDQQAALMASQRGSGANTGLIAKQAAMQGADIQQQAAGQAATMGAQQQLAAQSQLQNLAASQIGQQQGAQGQMIQGAQNQQNLAQQQYQAVLAAQAAQNNANVSMQSNINDVNAGIAKGNQKGQSDMFGGLLNTGLSMLPMLLAEGGQVPDQGEPPLPFNLGVDTNLSGVSQAPGGPTSFAGKFLSSMGQNMPKPTKSSGSGEGDSAMTKAGEAMGKGLMTGIGKLMGKDMGGGAAAIPAAFSPGGKVNGKSKVAGDSLKNDNVHAMLSPGEIVIPRSVVNGPDPVKASARFVQAIMAKDKMRRRA